jgi:hypothetical protein
MKLVRECVSTGPQNAPIRGVDSPDESIAIQKQEVQENAEDGVFDHVSELTQDQIEYLDNLI